MSAVAVDTSVLLAIFKGESAGEAWLARLLEAAETAQLLVSSVVMAEVRSFFPTDEACARALRDIGLHHSALTAEAALLAGKTFRVYRAQGGPRQTILPDFLIAAHAATQATMLATEDRGYLRRYFPSVRILAFDE